MAKKFQTILMDPPWPEYGGGKSKRGADRYYKLMNPKKILQTINESGVFVPAKDCHLYVWVTNNYLPKGIWLIEELGFRYITCLTWVKPSYGTGQYFRGQTEQLLFGRRGDGLKLRRAARKNFVTLSTLIQAPRRVNATGKTIHSAKPLAAYELIENASPTPRLDMFARSRRRGWNSWGDGVDAPPEIVPAGEEKLDWHLELRVYSTPKAVLLKRAVSHRATQSRRKQKTK